MFKRIRAILLFADACNVSEDRLSTMLAVYLGEV
jgi:hypothetical protein